MQVRRRERGGPALGHAAAAYAEWAQAQPGDYLCFAPELLGPEISYARLIPNAKGEMVEESDRWQQALVYTRTQMLGLGVMQKMTWPVAC